MRPGAVVGHLMGESAAAVVAGALSLEDAARVICRSKLMTRIMVLVPWAWWNCPPSK